MKSFWSLQFLILNNFYTLILQSDSTLFALILLLLTLNFVLLSLYAFLIYKKTIFIARASIFKT